MTSILITRGYSRTQIATFLALAMAAVVGAALAFEHIGGYIPCKLCLEQRSSADGAAGGGTGDVRLERSWNRLAAAEGRVAVG